MRYGQDVAERVVAVAFDIGAHRVAVAGLRVRAGAGEIDAAIAAGGENDLAGAKPVDRAVVQEILHGGVDELVLLQEGQALELRRADPCLEMVARAGVEVVHDGLRPR